MDLTEITDTIESLENSATTFDNCSKLASLYIVREQLQRSVTPQITEVESELKDILPQYRLYCQVKRKYQLNELTEQAVYIAMKDVCREIQEFIHTLYTSTDTPKEREMIKNLISALYEAF